MAIKDAILKRYYTFLAVAVVFMLGYDALLWFSGSTTTIWNYIFNGVYGIVYLFAAYLCYRGAKLTKKVETGRIARALRLWVFAFGFWGIGQMVWLYYNVAQRIDVPYPSVADLFFLAFYVPLGMGMLQLKAIEPLRRRTFFGEFLILLPLMLASVLIIFAYLHIPDFSSSEPGLTVVTDVLYVFGDAFLLAIALTGVSSLISSFKGAYVCLLIGLCMAAAGDIMFSYRTAQETYWNGGTSDVLFALFPVIFSIGVLKIIAQKTPKSRS